MSELEDFAQRGVAAQKSVEELIERSSLGSLAAKELRARASDAQVERVRELAAALDEPATVEEMVVAATSSQLRTMLQLDGICDHCVHEVLGNAGVNDDVLCHPDEGMDCYRLVTVYHHATPCRGCYEARLTFNRL